MTVATQSTPAGFDKVLARAWALFKKNWSVALPPVLAGFVIAIGVGVFVAVAIASGVANRHHLDSGAFVGTLVLGYLVLMVLALAVCVWAYAAMFGMADALWERGTASFADGNAAFRTRGGALFLAFIGYFLLAIVAMILLLPTLGLALLAYPLVTMYVMPAVVSGRFGGFASFGESWRLVRAYFVPSIIAALVLYGIMYGVSFLGGFAIMPLEFSSMPTGNDTNLRVPPIPLIVGSGLAYIVSLVASIAYSGFFAVAITGLYRELTGRPVVPPTAIETLPPPAPPSFASP